MSIPASPAYANISDTKPDGLEALPFIIFLFESLTMSLSIKQGTSLAIYSCI